MTSFYVIRILQYLRQAKHGTMNSKAGSIYTGLKAGSIYTGLKASSIYTGLKAGSINPV